jgi:GTPase
MFIDEVKIKLIAGRWGDWLVSWRREKCIPNGWPRWGDWGNGGNVFLKTTNNLNTLSDFRHKKTIKALDWEKWGIKLMHWSNGEDLVINVPIWTLVKDSETLEIIADLCEENMIFLICNWWRWWFWNNHFTSSTRQAPSFAELWDIWEEKEVVLELKLVADIWIIWIPSAWKSTLIWNITNVKPKIWDYPFTTITPNLWVLDHKNKSLVLEDVPGLIPWASQWKWLWIEFLKHIERTKVILHLLDLYRLDNIFEDYENIRYELGQFSKELIEKEEIIVFSKADLLDKEMKDFIKEEFKKRFDISQIFIISAATWEGIQDLKDYLIDNYTTSLIVNKDDKFINKETLKVYDLRNIEEDPKNVEIEYIWDYKFKASGKRLEQIVRMTDFSNIEAVMRIHDVLDKLWIIKKIEAKVRSIQENENIDNSHFFEWWNDENDFTPQIIIWGKEIDLDKLKFNL